MRPSQRGYVLLQVMLVFALLAIVAAKMQYEQRVQIERTRQSLFLSQAQTYAESAEAIAKVGLVLDAQNSDNDHLYELWNVSEGMFPLDNNGLIELEINDLQGRFNVNWLNKGNEDRIAAHTTLKRLLTLIEAPETIADELMDWFDADSGVDYVYMDSTPSYAPSYHAMADVSELLLLNAVDTDLFADIAPFFSALPSASLLNVNTAPIEILQSLAPFIDVGSAQEMIDTRGEEGFKSIDAFLALGVFQQDKKDEPKELVWKQIGVTSDWFELYTAVTLEERTLSQRSVLYRSADLDVTLTSRDRSANEANRIPGDPVKVTEDE